MTAALVVARDPTQWDGFVSAAGDGSILQSWAWGELKSRHGWQPTRYFWLRDGALRGAISVLRRRLPGGLAMDYAPHGPVLDGQLREWPALWAALRAELASRGGTILRVEPQWGKEEAWFMEESGSRPAQPIQHRATAMIDLRGGDQVFARMSASARRNMRQAERAGVTITISSEPKAVDDLYALLLQTANRQRFVIRSHEYYKDVFDAFNGLADPDRVGEAVMYLARHAEKTVAASMVIRYGRRLVYLFSGSTDRGRDLKAPYLIQQHAIRDAQAAGCTSYDLWGMPVDAQPGDPGWGYSHFKMMLGGKPVEFGGAWDLSVRRPLAVAYHLAERMVIRQAAVA